MHSTSGACIRGVQRVELARVARALDQQPGHALLGGGEGGLEVRPARDLPRDIAVQPAEEGAQPPDMAQRLPVAGAVHQPRRLAPGLGRETHEGLAQRHAVPAGEAGQPADAGVQQVAVGRVRHRFGLHRGVDGHPLRVLLLHRAAPDRRGDGHGQHGLQPLGADAPAPARHGGAVERQPVAEPGLAAERLEVRALDPLGADLLVREALGVLQQVQPGHQPRRQAGPPDLGVERAESGIQRGPVDQRGEAQQFVARVEDVRQAAAEQVLVAVLGRALRAHRVVLACTSAEGITAARRREFPACTGARNRKLFAPPGPKAGENGYLPPARNPQIACAAGILHGRLALPGQTRAAFVAFSKA
jgi:hypothetical protein